MCQWMGKFSCMCMGVITIKDHQSICLSLCLCAHGWKANEKLAFNIPL